MKAVPNGHGGQKPVAGQARSPRCAANTGHHHGSGRAGQQARRHNRGVRDALSMKRHRPRSIDAVIAESEEQRSEGQRVRGQKQPLPPPFFE